MRNYFYINLKYFRGYEIVAKGATKIESTLPESGVKDVFPNKSWLEDKQIQAAIEARKHIIEVERIDKRYKELLFIHVFDTDFTIFSFVYILLPTSSLMQWQLSITSG